MSDVTRSVLAVQKIVHPNPTPTPPTKRLQLYMHKQQHARPRGRDIAAGGARAARVQRCRQRRLKHGHCRQGGDGGSSGSPQLDNYITSHDGHKLGGGQPSMRPVVRWGEALNERVTTNAMHEGVACPTSPGGEHATQASA